MRRTAEKAPTLQVRRVFLVSLSKFARPPELAGEEVVVRVTERPPEIMQEAADLVTQARICGITLALRTTRGFRRQWSVCRHATCSASCRSKLKIVLAAHFQDKQGPSLNAE